ncbi:hypothetical protein SANBI_000413 [Sanguibacter sp. 4.1]|uniref:Sugar ABC transporter permease n=1 Tax=Sanguibacter biliveldensis TaxID=3030830 RepID=A0AAF0Z3S9_9MICO|nr:hypothetical protein [Sanguibacter sp. 4.1]WPF82795.1 hypothetical protein SANBI_000413 [Sanguibacter sp. 4.1]
MDQTTPAPVPEPTDEQVGPASPSAGARASEKVQVDSGRTVSDEPSAVDAPRASRRMSNARLAGWFVVVALFALAVLQYLLPALRLVQLATRDAVAFFEVAGSVGGANFSAVLDDDEFRASVGRALGYSIVPLAAALVLGPLVASVASRAGRATRLVSRGLLAVPLFCFSPVAYYVAQWGTQRGGGSAETLRRAQEVGGSQAELVVIAGLSVVGLVGALSATLYLAAMRRSAVSRAGWAASGVVTAVVVLAVTTLSLMVTTVPLLLTADLADRGTTTPGMLVYEWVFLRYDLPTGSAALALLLVPTVLVGVLLVALVLATRLRVEIVPRDAGAGGVRLLGRLRRRGAGAGSAAAATGAGAQPAASAGRASGAGDGTESRTTVASVLSVVLVSALAIASVVVSWPWLQGILETEVAPSIDSTTLQITTWLSSALTGLIVVVLAVVGGFGIGYLRPAGRRSEWLLLAFSPFLLVGTTSLLPALFEAGADEGTLGTLRGLVTPLWVSVPLLVLFTLVFADLRRSRDAGVEGAVRSAVAPVLGLVGLSGLVVAWVHGQQYLWPLVVSYGSDTSAPMLVRAAATPAQELAPVPFGLVAPLGVLVPCVVLGALCLVATDRLALRAGRADQPA